MTSPKRYAVVYVNLFDNELLTEIHSAASLIEAVFKHSEIVNTWNPADFPDDLKKLKQKFFDYDTLVDAVEIPA